VIQIDGIKPKKKVGLSPGNYNNFYHSYFTSNWLRFQDQNGQYGIKQVYMFNPGRQWALLWADLRSVN
jgi:hypothetical protein